MIKTSRQLEFFIEKAEHVITWNNSKIIFKMLKTKWFEWMGKYSYYRGWPKSPRHYLHSLIVIIAMAMVVYSKFWFKFYAGGIKYEFTQICSKNTVESHDLYAEKLSLFESRLHFLGPRVVLHDNSLTLSQQKTSLHQEWGTG